VKEERKDNNEDDDMDRVCAWCQESSSLVIDVGEMERDMIGYHQYHPHFGFFIFMRACLYLDVCVWYSEMCK